MAGSRRGEQVGEKGWFNDRLFMFLMKLHLAALYGATPLGAPPKDPATIAREAAENCPVCAERRKAESEAAKAQALSEVAVFLEAVFKRYEAKVAYERRARLDGRIVDADFTLRQLTHELILDIGGNTQGMIRLHIRGVPEDDDSDHPAEIDLNASPISAMLAQRRQAVWDAIGDPPRPRLDLRPRLP